MQNVGITQSANFSGYSVCSRAIHCAFLNLWTAHGVCLLPLNAYLTSELFNSKVYYIPYVRYLHLAILIPKS